jgi:hypothetical protein
MSDLLMPVLAGEHAVVWAYGVVGPLLAGDDQQRARDLLVAHQRTRDQLRASILAAGGNPPAAEPAYELPVRPTDAASARALAADVEGRLAAVYADLVAASSADSANPDQRQLGVDGMITAALRATDWGAPSVAFPGQPERAG